MVGHDRGFSKVPLPVFSAGDRCKQFCHAQGCPLFDVVPAFPLPTTTSPTFQGDLKMALERLSWRVTCPNRASFRLLIVARRGSCGLTRKFILLRNQLLVLCSKKEMRRSFQISKAWILFFRVSEQGPCFTAIVEDGGDKKRVQLELAFEALPYLVWSGHCCHC